MTAINFYLDNAGAIVTSDTLVTKSINVSHYHNKIFLLPKIKGVLFGVGICKIIRDFYYYLEDRVISDDICCIKSIAPKILNEIDIYKDYKHSTVIYLLAQKKDSNTFVGYGYDSRDNYASTEVKKETHYFYPPIDSEKYKTISNHTKDFTNEFYIKIMEYQREIDKNLNREYSIGIGGEINRCELSIKGYTFKTIHRFNDYDDLLEKMLENAEIS